MSCSQPFLPLKFLKFLNFIISWIGFEKKVKVKIKNIALNTKKVTVLYLLFKGKIVVTFYTKLRIMNWENFYSGNQSNNNTFIQSQWTIPSLPSIPYYSMPNMMNIPNFAFMEEKIFPIYYQPVLPIKAECQ